MRPDEIIRKILEIRGIVSEEDVREFLSSKPQLTHDPMLMQGMEQAADFLYHALSNSKRICIYGDYDVDGVCGTAMFVLFLREAALLLGSGSEINYYIPSRIEEGYGLNEAAILAIKNEGADVIVTVDCGSVSFKEAAYAREIGLDILITDHHDLDPDSHPDCVLLNPKMGGYPFDKLAGTAVAFKLCSALLTLIGEEERSPLYEMLDFVCVATVADVMPLIDENRTLVKYGGAMLKKSTRPAFLELLSVSGIEPAKLSIRDVAFGIAPRLNALGRLGDASEAVEFFLTDDENRMREIAGRMEKYNTERRRIQDECFKECLELSGAGAHFLLLKPKNSHEGVSGIVAGKIRDATGLPCAVLTEKQDAKGFLKGSARSAGKLDIIALFRKHAELFERLGGHAAAAGFTISEENEERLREVLSEDIVQMTEKEPDLLSDAVEPELVIETTDITLALAGAIEELAPFGTGNPKPALSFTVPAESISGIRGMGKDGKHLRFIAGGIPCVFFNGADTRFSETGNVRVVGCPEINEWNESRNIQFAVRHIDVLR